MEEVVKWAPLLSALASLGALIYIGIQFRNTNRLNRRNSFLNWLEKYFRLKEMIINKPALDSIYTSLILEKDLKPEEKHYIYAVLGLCEAMYLTREINPFPDEMPDVSWEGFIINQISTPTIKNVWDNIKTSDKKQEFSTDFTKWVDSKV